MAKSKIVLHFLFYYLKMCVIIKISLSFYFFSIIIRINQDRLCVNFHTKNVFVLGRKIQKYFKLAFKLT